MRRRIAGSVAKATGDMTIEAMLAPQVTGGFEIIRYQVKCVTDIDRHRHYR